MMRGLSIPATLPRGKGLAVVAAFFGFFGAVAWCFYVLTLRHVPGVDWMVFYTATQAYFGGHLPLLLDGDRFTSVINTTYAAFLSFPMNFLPWVNPPNFLLLLLPFGLLPFTLSYAAFEAGTFVLLLGAMALRARDGARWRLFGFALIACPATAFTVFLGQSSFLTGALLVGGFTLVGKVPILAGILFGILAYKPQFCLLIPIALIAGRHWRALLSTTATAIGVALASAAVFGIELWRQWFVFAFGADDLYRHWAATARLTGQSVYSCLVLSGASPMAASAAQFAAGLLAVAGVYWAFRRPMQEGIRLAILLAASLLAAPHVSTSDGLLAGLAAIVYLDARLDRGLRLGDAAMVMLVWLSPLFSPPHVFVIGTAIPILLLVFVVVAMKGGRSSRIGGATLGSALAR